MSEEIFDVVDEAGRVVGQAPRAACHGNPALLHQAVHVFVFDGRGGLFLQKRSANKDIQPGRWDTSVGGHLQVGEAPEDGARREMIEELGVTPLELRPAWRTLWRSAVESEFVRAYFTVHRGPFRLDSAEIDDGRFWSAAEIEAAIGTGVFTPNFEHEWSAYGERIRTALVG